MGDDALIDIEVSISNQTWSSTIVLGHLWDPTPTKDLTKLCTTILSLCTVRSGSLLLQI